MSLFLALRMLLRQLLPVLPASASFNFFSTEANQEEYNAQPVDVSSEPAYKAHFLESKNVRPMAPINNCRSHKNAEEHPVYDMDKFSDIEQTHHPADTMSARVAYYAIKILQMGFETISGHSGPGGEMTEKDWLHWCLFMESVAGVPGMVAGMLRHLRSLRRMKSDYGWIHTLLEEAANERMHLLIFMNLKQPNWCLRALVCLAQGIFFSCFLLAYLISPKTCHHFVGYLEEEAIKTYTSLLLDIETGHLESWKRKPAPLIAQTYYKLPEGSSVYDTIKCIRMDECHHRDVNHKFADLDQDKGVSPFFAVAS
ncbi:uncharacterized protein CCR75_009035 [Bremia lactucae]|uniref:Alternative oxidase n=1 Tax=Bremia lactucae TaxID=4779 RepID=A0A976II08_BRELC|nr:hypothetical protein CCR75_009035 [Bremia lactucae]